MQTLLLRIDNYLFSEAPATRLATLRMLIGCYVLWYVGARFSMLNNVASNDAALFEPVGLAWFLATPLSPESFRWLLIATLTANLAFIVGAFHRISGPLFGGLLAFLLCYRNSWTMIYHSDNVMLFHVLIIGLAPAATVWSLDAWRRKKTEPAAHWRFGFPVQLMCIVTVSTYFIAGIAKVAGPSGWAWVFGESMRSQILVDGLRKELLGTSAPDLIYVLYNQVALFTVVGIMSLVVELGAPAVLAYRRVSKAWALAAFGMHWGIYFIMGILFRYQLAGLVFLPFFPVERLVTWALPKQKPAQVETASQQTRTWSGGGVLWR